MISERLKILTSRTQKFRKFDLISFDSPFDAESETTQSFGKFVVRTWETPDLRGKRRLSRLRDLESRAMCFWLNCLRTWISTRLERIFMRSLDELSLKMGNLGFTWKRGSWDMLKLSCSEKSPKWLDFLIFGSKLHSCQSLRNDEEVEENSDPSSIPSNSQRKHDFSERLLEVEDEKSTF